MNKSTLFHNTRHEGLDKVIVQLQREAYNLALTDIIGLVNDMSTPDHHVAYETACMHVARIAEKWKLD